MMSFLPQGQKILPCPGIVNINCTGCCACEVACCQEHGWEAGMSGTNVMEQVQKLPNGKAYLTHLPFPAELCVLGELRTKKGGWSLPVESIVAQMLLNGAGWRNWPRN